MCTGCQNQGYLCPGNARNQGIIVLTLVYVNVAYSVWENKTKHIHYWAGMGFLYGTTKKVIDNPRGVLGQVSDRDAPHRPSTRNATRVKKGGRNYTFFPILMKNRGRNMTFSSVLLKYRGQNTTFSSCLLKYRGRNSTNFPETRKGGSKRRIIYSNRNLHRVRTPPWR